MMRSMYSAVSSLKAHQTKMDVIGNNIANVNTVGFKGSRVTFKETFAQTVKGAGGAQDGRGGTNPMQIGLGADVASIDVLQKRGAVERTDNVTDLMINGEGYFMVSDDSNFLNRYYTRAGNFKIDGGGNLVTQDGYKVLGYMADETGRLKSSIEGLKIDKSIVYPPQATKPSDPPIPGEEIVTFGGNIDSNTAAKDDVKIEIPNSNPKAYYPKDDLKVIGDTTGKPAIYSLDTVESEKQKKPVYVQENEAMSKALGRETTIEVFDDFGNVHQVKLLFTKKSVDTSGESTWQVDAIYMDKDKGAMVVNGTTNDYDSTTGLPQDIKTEISKCNGFSYGVKGDDAVQSFEITFDKEGKVKDGSNTKMQLKIGEDFTKGADALTFDIDLGKMTQFADKSNAGATFIKGYKQGALSEFAVAPNGEVIGAFDNGQRRILGRVALANFKNPSGLQKFQSNMFMETRNSGTANIGKPSQDGFAELNPGSLEMSNVDLGQEFTNMITTQRGFQANSRVITTTDSMIEELVNLKR
ncbi:flagellar hook protein FlgE [Tepidibacter hydrothermalis]|uniref:Flagellar hook protein FlgE n=1 Tax=Tepidibacter hydrothermalis TaxID=3036126 RepID=A0ABY8EFG0_9FIRM|nr:flagellar hook protein FlgE [Tepidibacter hydrothermalis]WFD11681.1 flagellar hook protein FlgE [Tepidibacter hydrothermalis]